MGFFDMDEFSKAAEDSTIVQHPLAGKLSLETKTSYLGMVIFSALVDDGKIDDKERKALRNTGLALSLPEAEIDETMNTLTYLKTNQEKMAFVKDSLPMLSDRNTSMFLFCDMVNTMTADGVLSDDAKSFLSGMAKFLKINVEDLNFLNEYTKFFPEEKKPEAGDVVYRYSSQKIPDGLVKYFTPVLNPVHIQGGNLPLGDIKIYDGCFVIDSKVVVGAGTKLLIKNSEIEFGKNGWIAIRDGDAEFIDSKFIAKEEKSEEKEESCQYMIHSTASKLSFSGCVFDGRMIRTAIFQANILDITNCKFDKLHGGNDLSKGFCVYCHDGVCKNCEFINCKGICIETQGCLKKCIFSNCSSNTNVVRVRNNDCASIILFKKCKAPTICYTADIWWKAVYLPDYLESRYVVCFLECSASNELMSGLEHYDGCQYLTWQKSYNKQDE